MMAGAGMLRARRRDVSVKPNRKLDRKSSRGMIYENEELRLRTIHINAEVEQGQNDIKKLRRENEQLRREIWSLRDEYDKLEEILKRQKNRAESEEYEDRSDEDDGLQSDYSFEEDERTEEDDTQDSSKEVTKDEQLENAENQKISSEKMTSSLHRLHVDFDDLSVVDEEEELKRDKDKKDVSSEDVRPKENKNLMSILKPRQLHENIPFYPATYDPPGLGSPTYYTECPFKFPSTLNLMLPPEATGIMTPPCPRLNVDQMLPVHDPHVDSVNDQVLHAPPLGWQTNVIPEKQMGTFGTQGVNGSLSVQGYGIHQGAEFPSFPNFFSKTNVERRQPSNLLFGNSVVENGWETQKGQGSDDPKKNAEEKVSGAEKPKHFFAPLPSKMKKQSDEPSPTTSHFGTGNSSSSGKTGSTVISKNQFAIQKGSADLCLKGAVPCEDNLAMTKTEQRTFLSTDNLLINEEKCSTGNQLVKSMSCQDLSSETQIAPRNEGKQSLMTKSDNTLDNISDSKPFKSHLTVTLKAPRAKQAVSPDTPEIPKLPSIESRLFKNPFLRNFEPSHSYMNQTVTRPLSVQVNDDNLCYYSPRPDVAYNRVHLDRYRPVQTDQNRLLIPSNQLIGGKLTSPANKHQIQVTSFERPSPCTLVSPSTAYNFGTMRRLNGPYFQNPNPYTNMTFLPRTGLYPQTGMMYYDHLTRKVPAQTQTSIDGDSHHEDEHALSHEESAPSTPSGQRRRRTIKKDKTTKPLSPAVQRRLKKQSSVTSSEVPDSPSKPRKRSMKLSITPTTTSEGQEDKNESRSSSSGQDSPKKDQMRRVSLYFNAKKRPSLASVKTTRSGSVDANRDKDLAINSEREMTNSMSSRDNGSAKTRKASTSSGNVPWCACWGNGCI